ncbi:ABC transporter ATP-binding protein [Castellaniella sp.]|uniref:ABC transporter ATP-binding protein n=1 Tax=Castellaniella sp. TaxID=1955812 RepID=UPI003564A0D1
MKFGGLTALADVSWSVSSGEILGIIGPNGAGKSTCLNAVTHFVPHQGKVLIGTTDISAMPSWRLHEYGIRRAFQQNNFFRDLSVLDNMVAVLMPRLGKNFFYSLFRPLAYSDHLGQLKARAAQILSRIGVPESVYAHYPDELSYGTQRMLSIALAYGSNPAVLMLDEPAAGLGGDDMDRLRMLILSFREEGLAVVVIEHHMDLIMEIADRILVLDHGRTLAYASPEAVQNDERVLEAYLGRQDE